MNNKIQRYEFRFLIYKCYYHKYLGPYFTIEFHYPSFIEILHTLACAYKFRSFGYLANYTNYMFYYHKIINPSTNHIMWIVFKCWLKKNKGKI